MNNREQKRPPIDIKELKKGEGEEPQKGPLTYVGKGGSGGVGATKSKMNLTQLILAVGLSILVFVLISNFWLTPKKDALVLLENQQLLETKQAGLAGSLSAESSRIENIIVAQADFAKKSELTGFSNSISSLGSKVSSLESTVGGYDSRIEDLEAASLNQTESIEALEEGGGIVGGGFDYFLLDNYLHVRVSGDGFYRFKFTLIESAALEGFISDDVLEYYTKSHELSGGDWTFKNLNRMRWTLEDEELGNLSDYDVYVELLIGNVEEVENGGDSW